MGSEFTSWDTGEFSGPEDDGGYPVVAEIEFYCAMHREEVHGWVTAGVFVLGENGVKHVSHLRAIVVGME